MINSDSILQLLSILGLGGFVLLIFVLCVWIIVNIWAKRSNVDARRDDMITTFAARFSDDLKQERERRDANEKDLHNELKALQEQFHITDKDLAREQGRREQMEKQINQQAEQIQKQGSKILELEKHYQASQQRIGELEAQVELLNKQLTEANKENSALQAQKRELEKLLELEKNRAESLNRLVEELRESAEAAASPDEPDVDDTIYPIPPKNAEESAEEQPS